MTDEPIDEEHPNPCNCFGALCLAWQGTASYNPSSPEGTETTTKFLLVCKITSDSWEYVSSTISKEPADNNLPELAFFSRSPGSLLFGLPQNLGRRAFNVYDDQVSIVCDSCSADYDHFFDDEDFRAALAQEYRQLFQTDPAGSTEAQARALLYRMGQINFYTRIAPLLRQHEEENREDSTGGYVN